MNKNSSRILIYAVIFLAVLNVTTFISIGINVRNTKKELPYASNNEIKTAQNFNGRYFRDKLKLSPTQMDSFRIVNNQFRSQARRINDDLNLLRSNMMNEMKRAYPDTIKLMVQSDSVGMMHAGLKKLTYKYYLGIKSICSEEQASELNNIFEQFFNADEHHRKQNQGSNRRGSGKGFGKYNNRKNNDSIN